MTINHNQLMNERLERMNELFRRAEAFQFEMDNLRESYGLVTDATQPQEVREEAIEKFTESFESVDTAITETRDVYDDIDIDDIINSMDLGIQL